MWPNVDWEVLIDIVLSLQHAENIVNKANKLNCSNFVTISITLYFWTPYILVYIFSLNKFELHMLSVMCQVRTYINWNINSLSQIVYNVYM